MGVCFHAIDPSNDLRAVFTTHGFSFLSSPHQNALITTLKSILDWRLGPSLLDLYFSVCLIGAIPFSNSALLLTPLQPPLRLDPSFR